MAPETRDFSGKFVDHNDWDRDPQESSSSSLLATTADDGCVEGSIVVVAKCPIPGKSKTRLMPLLGKEGSVRLAKSMLSDVLKTINGCPELNRVRKVLVYAPGTPEGRERMENILCELGFCVRDDTDQESGPSGSSDAWHLLPMMSSSKSSDLVSCDLGAKLEDSLVRVRELESFSTKGDESRCHRGVVFLGMDAPILPLDDIVGGLRAAAAPRPEATLCPARDGGYAMLCVPRTADPRATFANMYWSHPWTGMSQIKALTDQGIFVRLGTIVRDVDEPDDVVELCSHLGIHSPQPPQQTPALEAITPPEKGPKKNLEFPGGISPSLANTGSEGVDEGITSAHPTCYFTKRTLEETAAEHILSIAEEMLREQQQQQQQQASSFPGTVSVATIQNECPIPKERTIFCASYPRK